MELCLIVLFILSLCNAYAQEYEACETPNGERGECITIKDCDSLYTLVKKRTTSREEIDLLKKSHCGFLGSDVPKVCCRDVTTDMATMPDDQLFRTPTSHVLPDASSCGSDHGKKIYGGESTELDEFPWMALLSYSSPDNHRQYRCGGTIISKRYILTAAHCLKDKDENNYWKLVSVRLGEYNKDSDDDCVGTRFTRECLLSPPIDVEVEEEIIHQKFDPDDINLMNDVALIRLKKDVKFTDYIKPICLPLSEKERMKNFTGANLTIAGWGATEKPEGNKSSSVKLKAVVPVRSSSYCNSIYKYAAREISETQLCAGGEKQKDSCKGDSGGPLMAISIDENGDSTWYAAGIISYGSDPCALEGWPAIYTKVSKYIGWIVRHMRP